MASMSPPTNPGYGSSVRIEGENQGTQKSQDRKPQGEDGQGKVFVNNDPDSACHGCVGKDTTEQCNYNNGENQPCNLCQHRRTKNGGTFPCTRAGAMRKRGVIDGVIDPRDIQPNGAGRGRGGHRAIRNQAQHLPAPVPTPAPTPILAPAVSGDAFGRMMGAAVVAATRPIQQEADEFRRQRDEFKQQADELRRQRDAFKRQADEFKLQLEEAKQQVDELKRHAWAGVVDNKVRPDMTPRAHTTSLHRSSAKRSRGDEDDDTTHRLKRALTGLGPIDEGSHIGPGLSPALASIPVWGKNPLPPTFNGDTREQTRPPYFGESGPASFRDHGRDADQNRTHLSPSARPEMHVLNRSQIQAGLRSRSIEFDERHGHWEAQTRRAYQPQVLGEDQVRMHLRQSAEYESQGQRHLGDDRNSSEGIIPSQIFHRQDRDDGRRSSDSIAPEYPDADGTEHRRDSPDGEWYSGYHQHHREHPPGSGRDAGGPFDHRR